MGGTADPLVGRPHNIKRKIFSPLYYRCMDLMLLKVAKYQYFSVRERVKRVFTKTSLTLNTPILESYKAT